MAKLMQSTPVVGGVDTHKDLHVAAVVDGNDQVLGTHIRCLKRYIAREVFNIIARRHKQINQAQMAA